MQAVSYSVQLAGRLHSLDDGEPRARGASGGVFVGQRKPEARHHPLCVALHDRAAEPLHGLLARLQKRQQHVRLILRVQLQIRLGPERVAATDQNGQLPALGLTGEPNPGRGPSVRGRWHGRRLRRGGRRRGGRRRCRSDRRPGGLDHPLKVFGEVGRRGVPILLALRERLQADALQVRRDVAHELTRRLRLIVAHLPQQLRDFGRPERRTARQELVQHDAQAIEVGAPVDAVRRSPGLFGRHVLGGTRDATLLFPARLLFAQREAEVHQHRHAIAGDDDVRGFDVAVDDAPRVGMAKGIEHGNCDPRRVLPRHPILVHPGAEVGPLEVIRDDMDFVLVHLDVVHGHDTGMVQLREPPRLLPRPFGVGLAPGPSA